MSDDVTLDIEHDEGQRRTLAAWREIATSDGAPTVHMTKALLLELVELAERASVPQQVAYTPMHLLGSVKRAVALSRPRERVNVRPHDNLDQPYGVNLYSPSFPTKTWGFGYRTDNILAMAPLDREIDVIRTTDQILRRMGLI